MLKSHNYIKHFTYASHRLHFSNTKQTRNQQGTYHQVSVKIKKRKRKKVSTFNIIAHLSRPLKDMPTAYEMKKFEINSTEKKKKEKENENRK